MGGVGAPGQGRNRRPGASEGRLATPPHAEAALPYPPRPAKPTTSGREDPGRDAFGDS